MRLHKSKIPLQAAAWFVAAGIKEKGKVVTRVSVPELFVAYYMIYD